MGRYDTAQICLNGHVMTKMYSSPEFRKKYCEKCGEPTITQCTECKTLIRGSYEGVYGATYEVPAYCRSCGKPYPWTKIKIESAEELTNELENLSEEEIKIIKNSINDMVSDTPKTQLATTRFKKLITKAGGFAVNTLRDLVIDIASDTAKKYLQGF